MPPGDGTGRPRPAGAAGGEAAGGGDSGGGDNGGGDNGGGDAGGRDAGARRGRAGTSPAGPRRGQVYWLDVPGVGRRPWLVVSADEINVTEAMEHLVAVRVATSDRRRHLPTVVPLAPGEPLTGSVLAGTVTQVRRDRFIDLAGSVSPATMRAVDLALREALGLG